VKVKETENIWGKKVKERKHETNTKRQDKRRQRDGEVEINYFCVLFSAGEPAGCGATGGI